MLRTGSLYSSPLVKPLVRIIGPARAATLCRRSSRGATTSNHDALPHFSRSTRPAPRAIPSRKTGSRPIAGSGQGEARNPHAVLAPELGGNQADISRGGGPVRRFFTPPGTIVPCGKIGDMVRFGINPAMFFPRPACHDNEDFSLLLQPPGRCGEGARTSRGPLRDLAWTASRPWRRGARSRVSARQSNGKIKHSLSCERQARFQRH